MSARQVGLAALIVLGCNGRFNFDEHGADAAAESGVAPDDTSVAAEPVTCSPDAPACLCSGSFCSCARQRWCRFTGSVCVAGSPCAFLCHNGSRCDGQCRGDCKLECEHGSTCAMTMGENAVVEGESSTLTVTVGPMSHVHCENSALCHVTCTGACSLECQTGAHCDLRCPGDATARSADQGGSCSG